MVRSALLYSLIIFYALFPKLEAINASEKELNEEVRKEILKRYKGVDIENYKELLKMVKINAKLDGLEVFYDSDDYVNVGYDEIGDSDEFFARILYPCKRSNSEYSNWITSVQLNPKAQFILAKAAMFLSNIEDLVYMLKKTRPGISAYQLNGILEREHLIKKPLKIDDSRKLKDVIKISGYIYNLATYSFLATMKKPFTTENVSAAKNIVLSIVVASTTAYATQILREKALSRGN